MSIFKDSKIVMKDVFQQTTDIVNFKQSDLYMTLVKEEFTELKSAYISKNYPEILDGIIDVLVTAINLGLSLNLDLDGAWNEVLRSNIAKIDPLTGKSNKRKDGKVTKPTNWQSPQLEAFIPKELKIVDIK